MNKINLIHISKFFLKSNFTSFFRFKPFLNISTYKFSNLNKDTMDTLASNFNNEFDKMLSDNEEDIEKRVKLLSIKLIQQQKSRDILYLYEDKYIKGLVNKIYGEELSLMIYFYISLLDKEYSDINSNNQSKLIL